MSLGQDNRIEEASSCSLALFFTARSIVTSNDKWVWGWFCNLVERLFLKEPTELVAPKKTAIYSPDIAMKNEYKHESNPALKRKLPSDCNQSIKNLSQMSKNPWMKAVFFPIWKNEENHVWLVANEVLIPVISVIEWS